MNNDDYVWIPAQIFRTALGNWYYMTPKSDRACLLKRVTEHPSTYLARSRMLAISRTPGSAVYKGKVKMQRNGNFDPSRRTPPELK